MREWKTGVVALLGLAACAVAQTNPPTTELARLSNDYARLYREYRSLRAAGQEGSAALKLDQFKSSLRRWRYLRAEGRLPPERWVGDGTGDALATPNGANPGDIPLAEGPGRGGGSANGAPAPIGGGEAGRPAPPGEGGVITISGGATGSLIGKIDPAGAGERPETGGATTMSAGGTASMAPPSKGPDDVRIGVTGIAAGGAVEKNR